MRRKVLKAVEALKEEPFSWGTNDCLIFPMRVYEAVTGRVALPFREYTYSTPEGAVRAFSQGCVDMGVSGIHEMMALHFTKAKGVGPIGSIVVRDMPEFKAMKATMGVCVGDRVAFVDDNGLKFLPIEIEKDSFWVYDEIS